MDTTQRLSFSFPELRQSFRIQLQKKLPAFDELKGYEISAMKFEAAPFQFLSDVFLAVAVVVA